jgi:hypothetical protein
MFDDWCFDVRDEIRVALNKNKYKSAVVAKTNMANVNAVPQTGSVEAT